MKMREFCGKAYKTKLSFKSYLGNWQSFRIGQDLNIHSEFVKMDVNYHAKMIIMACMVFMACIS